MKRCHRRGMSYPSRIERADERRGTRARTRNKRRIRPREGGSEDVEGARSIRTWIVASRFAGLALRMTKTSSGKKSSAPALFPFSCSSSISVVQHCICGGRGGETSTKVSASRQRQTSLLPIRPINIETSIKRGTAADLTSTILFNLSDGVLYEFIRSSAFCAVGHGISARQCSWICRHSWSAERWLRSSRM